MDIAAPDQLGHDLAATPAAVLEHPGMTSPREKALLYWLAREAYSGEGIIVDAGLFLGASTNAFAHGVRNGRAASRPGFGSFKPIHSYDIAIWAAGMNRYLEAPATQRALAGRTIRPGQSFRPILEDLLSAHADLVEFRFGDIVRTAAADRPVEIAFYDCLKTGERDAAAFRAFGPHYLPGRTVVVQQDYFFEDAADLKIRQEFLAPYFSYLGGESTSAVFRLDKPLPERFFREDPVAGLSVEEKTGLLMQAAGRSRDPKFEAYGRLAVVDFLAGEGRIDAARERLAEVERAVSRAPNGFGPRMAQALAALHQKIGASSMPPASAGLSASVRSDKFNEVTRVFGPLPYMTEDRALKIRELVHECDGRDLLELGFYHGKSSAYFGAILEDRGGAGKLVTIDVERARELDPNIHGLTGKLGLTHRIDARFAKRSYTWEMARMLKDGKGPRFDFCYFDGGHTWDLTGFGLLLVDMLLRPGGIVVIDDLNWTIARSMKTNAAAAKSYRSYDEDEKNERGVRLAWNTIIPHLGYTREEVRDWPWGIARKPKK